MQEPIDGLTITSDCEIGKSAVEELSNIILEDVKVLREQGESIKERLPVEIMALNAICGAAKLSKQA